MVGKVYQFKIQRKNIAPPVWRRILVPERYDFWDLHVAIQDAMGWSDYHLHAFRARRRHARSITEIGIPDFDEFDDGPKTKAGWETPITDFFDDLGFTCEYEYDFGDGWHHEVVLEGILLREKGIRYPVCIDGARACPPEDCGGDYGYYRLLDILSDPDHEEYRDMIAWLGGAYDPEHFVPDEVVFDNPKKRWRISFGELP